MLRRALILITGPLLLLCGCGNSRTPVPSLRSPAAPKGFRMLAYPASGVAFSAPQNWTVTAQTLPLVTVVSSGSAVVAVWRFSRSQPLPANRPALRHALAALIASARAHDPTIQLIRSRILTLDHARAIELDAFERVGSAVRRVRSTHLFAYRSEIVLEEYAPANEFHAVDHMVFSPVRRSLQISPA